jgi:hypothetical protein
MARRSRIKTTTSAQARDRLTSGGCTQTTIPDLYEGYTSAWVAMLHLRWDDPDSCPFTEQPWAPELTITSTAVNVLSINIDPY